MNNILLSEADVQEVVSFVLRLGKIYDTNVNQKIKNEQVKKLISEQGDFTALYNIAENFGEVHPSYYTFKKVF